jgi:accessory colonization factor AcfC
VGIIVRKGNPRGIRGLEDLHREGVRVMMATLERVAEFHDEPAAGDRTPHAFAYTGDDALRAWRSDPSIDAWITYKSWHAMLAAESEFIEIPRDEALRETVIAITARTPRREAAEKFIAFLRTPAAQRIFREHGWE